MTVTRHPDTAWLMDYANGTLSRNFELVLAAHLMACPHCARELQAAERLGAELMMQGAGSAARLAPATVLAAESGASYDWITARPSSGLEGGAVDLPSVVSKYLDCGIGALPWRRAGRGLRQALPERRRQDAPLPVWKLMPTDPPVPPRRREEVVCASGSFHWSQPMC